MTSEAIDLAADDVVVSALHLAPRPIPDPGRLVGGADDIGEQDGREHAFGPRVRMAAGEEAFDLVREQLPTVGPGEMAGRDLHGGRVRDVLGHVSRTAHVDGGRRALRSVDHERGNADRRQHLPHIRHAVLQRLGRSRAGAL